MATFKTTLKPRAQEFFGGYKFIDYLNFLRKSQFYKKQEILNLQTHKLEKLICHSANHVKFYSDFFKKNDLTPSEIKTSEDLVKLPVMTKDIYREHFPDDIVDPNAKKYDLYLNSSSGSTGAPFKFYMTRNHRGNTAARVLRYFEWAGRNYGDLLVKIWGSVHFPLKIKLFHKYLENIMLVNAFNLNLETFPSYYEKIRSNDVKLIEAYTSGAYAFALMMKDNDLFLEIPATILSGETIYDFQKNLIKERFNTEIYNRYGCREFGAIAQECSEHVGLHISQEDFMIEILDNENEPVADGERGNIYVTCLDNLSMPLIRYRIDDIGIISTDTCSCGRELKMFKSVEGRVSDMITSPSGRHISLYFFALVFQVLSDQVKEFQVQQKKHSHQLIIKIVSTSQYNAETEKEIIKKVKDMDNSFDISIDLVDEIPLEPTGKKKYLKII